MKPHFFLLIPFMISLNVHLVYAQTALEQDWPTRKVDKKVKENKKENFPKQESIRFIYVKDGKKVLYGNPCAVLVTHQMGFEYGIEHRKNLGFVAWWRRFKNNTTTKTILFFTKGPWWKISVDKKLRLCVQSSGDRRG